MRKFMLENTLFKLKNREKFTVGYFGGSITEGSGASNAGKTSWRARITSWLRENYPNCEIIEVQAAIGGTGSELGVYRCDRDLISQKPDLVFYEFSVNDSENSDIEPLFNNTESIFRKIFATNDTADIIVLHTMTESIANALENGFEYVSRTAHTLAAHYYGVPVIEIGEALRSKVKASGGDWLKYTTDRVHPNDDGYLVYTECIKNHLERMLQSAEELSAPLKRSLPKRAFDSENTLESAHIEDSYQAELGNGWSMVDRNFCRRYPHYIEATESGAELTFKFWGKRIGVYFMIASDSGDFEATIDNGEPQIVRTWDKYALSFNRAGHQTLACDLPYGEHVLRIKVSPEKAENSKGTAIRIGAFLVS